MNMHDEFLAQMVRAFAQANRGDEKWQAVTRETVARLVEALSGALIRDAAELNDVLPPSVDKVGFRSEPEFALTYRNFDGVLSIGEGGQKLNFIISDRSHPELEPVSKVHVAAYGYRNYVRYTIYGDEMMAGVDRVSQGLLQRFVYATNAERTAELDSNKGWTK
jgi:hypothetical protein